MSDIDLSKKIIQTLLYFGESVKIKDIGAFLKIDLKEIEENIAQVKKLLGELGLRLIQNETSLEIVLSDEISKLIQKQKIEDLKVDLSESALQTLSVILYKDKPTKAEIDFIRGVDSGRSIKNLITRGLIEREEVKNRKYYFPTTETLKYLGLENKDEIVDRNEISDKLYKLINGEN